MPLDPNTVPRPSRDAAWKDIAGETVVLDVRHGIVRGLNATGGRVWALIDGRRSAAEIAGLIAEATGAPPDRVLADVLTFLERLEGLGVIEVG